MTETPAHPRPPALEMRGVAVHAMRDASVTVAENVEWTVNEGEFWVVAAPQHSGKSDFLMTTGGLSSPARGEYLFLGEPMPIFEEPRLPHRLKLGFVFDGGQLSGQLTVAENIALPLRYHQDLPPDEVESRVRQLLDLTELTPWADSTPANLGRSWQQRCGLARALALRPEVLLLDSPLTGLDARHANWWLNFLEQLSVGHSFMGGRPVTLVVTTDDLSRFAGRSGPARRFAVLNGKNFLVIGAREQLDRSADPLVKELMTGTAPRD